MHVISRKALIEFAEKYPDSQTPLDVWFRIMETNKFDSFDALRKVFPSADKVGGLYVFNIGGNKYRIRNQQQHNQAIEMLNNLLDIVGDNENHPLYDLLDTLGTLIKVYEDSLYPEPDINEVDVLKYLMTEHNISDIPEIGDRGCINALLSGQHQMTIGDVKALSQHFNVSVSTFLN